MILTFDPNRPRAAAPPPIDPALCAEAQTAVEMLRALAVLNPAAYGRLSGMITVIYEDTIATNRLPRRT